MAESQFIKRLAFCAFIFGLLSVLFYVLHDVIGAMNYPGYDAMSQAVSDLTATDAPSFAVASGYSAVYGIFSCLCCAFLCIIVSNQPKVIRIGVYLFTAMEAISAIGYSLFPLSSAGYDGSAQSFIHVYILTALVVILSIASLLTIAIGSFRNGRKALAVIAAVAFVLMLVGAIGSMSVPKEIFGVFERFSTYSAVVFAGAMGIYWYLDCRNRTDTAVLDE